MTTQELVQRFPGVFIWYPHLSNIGLCEIGFGTNIHSHVWIGDGVVIGKRCKIQAFSFLCEGVTLEDDVFVGPGVIFTNDKHPPSDKSEWLKIMVRKGAKLGAGSVYLPGIEIGENATIGAGAIVTKSVPANETWVGNPARKL